MEPIRPDDGRVDTELEAVVLSVSDVDRTRHFYRALGFRLVRDDVVDDGLRIVQLTPPGSACSIVIGTGVSPAPPGSSRLVLKVDDVKQACAELHARGAALGPVTRCSASTSYAGFSDPDGNQWLLVEG